MQKRKGNDRNRSLFFLHYAFFYGIKALGIGLSPVVPKVKIAVPVVVRFEYQVFVEGRKIVGSNLPSPS